MKTADTTIKQLLQYNQAKKYSNKLILNIINLYLHNKPIRFIITIISLLWKN